MTNEPKILPKENVLKINVEHWNYRDFMEFGRSMKGDMFKALNMAQSVIVSWGFSQDPTEPNALADLQLHDSAIVLREIGVMVDAALERVSAGDVSVDILKAGWSFKIYYKFLQALDDGDYATVQSMVHSVASVPTLKSGETLPLVEGVQMVKAIQKRYKEILEGKF